MAYNQKTERGGQALVEFAIISFVLTAMLAGFLGLIVLGLGSFQNNIATESIGRVLDQHPRLSAGAFLGVFGDSSINPYTATATEVLEVLTYDEAAFNTEFGAPLYHERHLVLSPAQWASRQNLPELNQILIPSYVFDPDVVPDDETAQGAYRYPGAVVKRTLSTGVVGETYQTVLVPLLDTAGVEPCNDADCQCESAHWVAPLRICKILDCDCTAVPAVATNPIGSEPTFVMSLVYPSQPASMMSIEVERDAEGRIVSQTPVEANDSAVPTAYASELGTLPSSEYSFSDPSENSAFGASASRGRYGLGETNAFLTTIRPYRRIFEARTSFRLRFGFTAAKYEADGSAIALTDVVDDIHTNATPNYPFVQFEDRDDQFLNLGQQVLDREPDDQSLVIPDVPPSSGTFNDFEYRALVIPATGAGTWRVSVGSEFQPAGSGRWMEDHTLELRLYRNGEFEQLIATATVTPPTADTPSAPASGTNDPVQLLGQAVCEASADDVFQVRVFTSRPTGQTYDTELTGDPMRNWITYEFLSGR